MNAYILDFHEIDPTQAALAGGKGANLGELSRIPGILVPGGFCITTAAYKTLIADNRELDTQLEALSRLKSSSSPDIVPASSRIRDIIENLPVPGELETEIDRFLQRSGEQQAYAIRSSATAEDLPGASFAGQQDTYLNISGKAAILKHIRRCWASLFTERAVSYRIRNGFDHRKVYLSVVVQQMVFPQASGMLFTADPLSGNRRTSSIDAGFGLGEALVSGRVNADHYQVREGRITEKQVAAKQLGIYAAPGGGTVEREIPAEQQTRPALSDAQILELEQLGRKIEARFGAPQDIEWCLADDESGNKRIYIVQSRPITTLFPVPEETDGQYHVYLSVGHQQMMTDAMKPLGLSFYLMTTRAPMRTAGGRLFVEVTPMLASAANRQAVIHNLGQYDPLIKDALETIVQQGQIPTLPGHDAGKSLPASLGVQPAMENDPAIVAGLIDKTQASLAALKRDIPTKSGIGLLDFIREDMQQLRELLFDPQNHQAILASMNAAFWLNEKMLEWLGVAKAADTLSQSAPGNITSEMGLALLEVADAIRPHPEVIAYLQQTGENFQPGDLTKLPGGTEAREAIVSFLDKYGMRCAGEIDISKPRWSEQPATLVPLILSNIKNFEPGAGQKKFEQGLREALKKEQELLERLEQLPDGAAKARETRDKIGLLRNFAGYREFPKYGMVSRYFIYKQALLREAEQLVQSGLIGDKYDIFYLSFEELYEVLRTQSLDESLISRRKEAHQVHEKLHPPRVLSSDGDALNGQYRRNQLPDGALAGLAVSSGVVEGRARVILNMADAEIEDGDILVTSFTDPSWTPLFVSIKGLVTEVGSLMTHGAVIAREYGLPAVVGVENATRLIKDGDRVRVNGTEGWVEVIA